MFNKIPKERIPMNAKQIVSLILSFNLIFTNLMLAASIEVDKTAAAKNQATLLKSSSGIQIVDIVNPNSKGMSHNKFKTYNVNKSGLILNNSKVIVKTQLAGQIAFNPNLKNNARVILNEVTGTSKSLLRGYTEVAGSRADVIVANPNGITINGGGFINTNKVTLTTGRSNYLNGFVNGFTVNKGDILIEGDGFNVSDINKVELYSKALILNAKFYAKDLKVVTGSNSITLDGVISSNEVSGSGISIDSSILGGIYADSIVLISNDKGVGVTLPPEVIASNSLILNADGTITTKKIQAKNSIKIESISQSVHVEDSILSDDISIDAKNEIDIKKDENLSIVSNNELSLHSKTLNNNAFVKAKVLKIQAEDVNNQGTLLSEEKMIIEATTLRNSETIESKGEAELYIKDLLVNDKIISSASNLVIAKNDKNEKLEKLINNNTIHSEKNLNIDAKILENEGYIYSGYDKNLGNVDNSTKAEINVDTLTNNGFITANDLNITATKVIDNKGALYSRNNLLVKAKELNNYETIRSNKDIDLLIENSLNNENMIYADGTITLASNEARDKKNTINNTGIIQAEGDINIFAKVLNNTANAVEVTNTNTSTSRKSGSGNNYDLITKTTKSQVLNINTLDPSLILSDGNINIDVETLNNLYSLIASNKDITLNANTVNNVGKVIVSTITTVTKKYRSERYCSWGGPSGSCFKHKNRAAYRGTTTSTTTTKTPIVNFGIQAKNSISGNVINLKNVSDQLAGSLSNSEISTKQAVIDLLSNRSTSLQDLNKVLDTSIREAISLINSQEDLETLASNVETQEDLDVFKSDLNSYKDNLGAIIQNDETTIVSLGTSLEDIKNNNTSNVSLEDINSIENTIESLKENIVLNKKNLSDFENLNDLILTVEDVANNKQSLIDIEDSIKTIYTSNEESLTSLGNKGNITNIVSSLESRENTLRDEVNLALSLQSDIKYKIISKDEGLYQTNSSTSTKTVDDAIKSDPSAAINEIFVPSSKFGIFVKITKPGHKFLIESNPLFTNYKIFLSSNYMLSKLNLDPEKIIKRLGDAMYETNFVRDSIIKATGSRFLSGFSSDISQFQALMDNAILEEKNLNLSFGVSLSKEQVALLDNNIVWLEEKMVAGELVLVPQVYLATNVKTADGVKLEATNIALNIEETLINDSKISASEEININARDITNQAGIIKANKDINLKASNAINNISGKIISEENITLEAKMINILRASSKVTNKYAQGEENLSLKGQESFIQAKGNIELKANNDINIVSSKLTADENIDLGSKDGNINISSLESVEDYSFKFSNGYSKGKSIKNLASSIEAKNINLDANNLVIKSSKLSAKETISLEGVKDINILAANDLEYTDTKIKTSSGFMGSKTTRDMNYKETVVSSKLDATNIIMSSDQNIVLEAANLKAQETIKIDAKKDIIISAKEYKEGSLHEVSKSSWGGLKKSYALDKHDALKLNEANLKAQAKNIELTSGNDINILASNLDAAQDLKITALNEVNVLAGEELEANKKIREKSSFNILGLLNIIPGVDMGPIYSQEIDKNEKYDAKIKSSSLTAGSNISIDSGSTKIVASNLSANDDVKILADTGKIEILSGKEKLDVSTLQKKIEIKISNIMDMVSSLFEQAGDTENTKIKINLASATYDKEAEVTSQSTNIKSNITSKDANIVLDATDDVNIVASNLSAGETIAIKSEVGNINIIEDVDTKKISKKETHAKAEINLTIQNEYAEIATAAKALIESKKQLSKVKKDYSNYKKEVKKLNNILSNLKQEYKNKAVGIDKDDISDLIDLLDDLNDDKKFYTMAIAAAAVDVTTKALGVAKQMATAAQSSGTYGFSAGLSFDLEGSKTKSEDENIKSIASQLKAKNIVLITDKDSNTNVNISGSNIVAQENIVIETKDLFVSSSTDTTQNKKETKDISGSVSMTMYGASSGPTISLGFGKQNNESDSLKHNNSQLKAKNITIEAKNDAIFEGANIDANEALVVNVGNDLVLKSQRNQSSSNSKGFNVSASMSLGASSSDAGQDASGNSTVASRTTANQQVGARTGNGEVSGGNASYCVNQGRTKTKQTVLSTLTGNTVDINVGNNTHIKGSLIAAGLFDKNNTFADNENLNLNTKTLSYENSSNTTFNSGQGVTVGAGDSTVSLKLNNELGFSKTKSLATLGKGNIQISDKENSDDLSALNTDTSKLVKDLYKSSTGVKVDATLDTRILSEEGRASIQEDFERSSRLLQAIGDVATKDSIILGDTFDHILDVQKDLDVQKELSLKDNGKLIAILDDKNRDKYTQKERDSAINEYAQIYAKHYEISIENAKSAIISDKYGAVYATQDNSSSKIFIDDVKNKGALDTANVMGHEIAHVRINQGQTRERTGDLAEEYGDTFGKYSSEGMEFSSETYNNVNLNTNPSSKPIIRTTQAVDTLVDNTKDYFNDKAKADVSNGKMDDSVIPGAAYIRWLALGGKVSVSELLNQEARQDIRIVELTGKKLFNQGKEVIEMAKNLPKTIAFLYDHPEEIKKLPSFLQEAIVQYIKQLGDNAKDIGKGLLTNNSKAIESQAQAEASLIADLATTIAGAGIGKLAVVGGKVVVGKSVLIAKKFEISKVHIEAKKTNFKDGNGKWIYPNNKKDFDAIPGTIKDNTLQKGDILVRYVNKDSLKHYDGEYNLANDKNGTYTTKPGESWESLSLPGKKEDYVAYKIEVLEDIPTKQSLVSPWFDQVGGGVQNKFDKSISELAKVSLTETPKLKLIGEYK